MGTDEPLAALVVERRGDGAGLGTFVVGVAGAVAVGKSTLAARLVDSLRRTLGVELVSTDAFLLPNRVLDTRGLTLRKGFPESYDVDALEGLLSTVRASRATTRIPVYSHAIYDVVEGETRELRAADVLVLEGVNALRLADHLDLGVYVDAPESLVEDWYVARFVALVDAARDDPSSFYAGWVGLSPADLEALARGTWQAINLVNLREHIAPTRALADVVVEMGAGHDVVATRVTRPGGPGPRGTGRSAHRSTSRDSGRVPRRR